MVYAMQISEVLDFDEYYRDERFTRKKPKWNGTDKERCGDNIYHREKGRWVQEVGAFHGREVMRKDLKYHTMLISRTFYYFGAKAEALPDRFSALYVGRGCKHRHDADMVQKFLRYLTTKYATGRHANPRDWPLENVSSDC